MEYKLAGIVVPELVTEGRIHMPPLSPPEMHTRNRENGLEVVVQDPIQRLLTAYHRLEVQTMHR
jgi:hypothetical protein